MPGLGYLPYKPQLTPIAWADGIWTVEGPEIGYGIAGVTVPCPTRMTVVRLGDGTLWLHSPVAYSDALARALSGLGEVGVLVAPNSYHHAHIEHWAAAVPGAVVHAAPDPLARLGRVGEWLPLGAAPPANWDGALDQVLVDLGRYTEVVFFHRASRTLVVTDLMQNFEADRVRGPVTRLLLRAAGVTGPNGRASAEIRLAALGRRRELRDAVRRMLDWEPTGIILSHGRCYDRDAVDEIRRAFAWAGV